MRDSHLGERLLANDPFFTGIHRVFGKHHATFSLGQDLPCIAYMDDILIVASDQEESDKNLQKALHMLDENGVKLNRDKCEFHRESVDFLGYTWSSKGIRISERVVQDVLNAPFPSDHTALRSFLGLTSYVCASNVPHASDLLNPLWDLLSRERLESDPAIVQHFQRIKQEIWNLHPQTFFQASKPVVQADASGYVLGAVLLQEERPKALFSN